MTLFDFSQAIKKLNQEKKCSAALQFFKENKNFFTTEQIGTNKYIVYEMIYALIETNHFEAIFMFIERYKVILDPKSFSFLLKKFKNKPSVNWKIVNRFCDLISVDKLDSSCMAIQVARDGKNKQMELASDKENWYAFKTKALFETQQYRECFEVSRQALEAFQKFHYSNDAWFARRIALSKKNLGNSTDALNELLLILKRKKEWFIQREVAEIYKEKGEPDKAFQYAIESINNFGDLEYKVGLLVLIAEILEERQEKELSFKHYMLSKLLRQQSEWNTPPSLENSLQKLNFPQLPLAQLSNLKKELRTYWNTLKRQQDGLIIPSHQLAGKIDKILHNNEKGADGFIRYDNNKSIYFRLNPDDELIKILSVGLDVKFKILPPRNDQEKERAINIKHK